MLALLALPASSYGTPSYITPAGAVRVVGYNDMQGMLDALNARFIALHPGTQFDLVLKGTRTAPQALARGSSAFAPMGAEFSDAELADYRAVAGGDPIQFRVAHASLNPAAKSGPLAIFVHRDNPLPSLTLEQVMRIFAEQPDRLSTWSQLGLGRHAIHPIGLHATTALALFLQRHKFGGRPYTSLITTFPQSADVIRAVGEDRDAIGFAAMNLATPQVRVVPLVACVDMRPSSGSEEDIVAGVYPLDRHLYIYARQPIEPLVAAYLRLVLSREGQRVIAQEALQYLPLNDAEIAVELAKLPEARAQ
ncbi:substrate-binding domain-containing protein [Roseiterribacter gracilis]|uniref:Phosphate-binding protein PstS n=1 Tax=Roseiterribacter gracilis TaxID=2812848 RepID=A0A8S8XGZ7_9PROT|nr:phosphate-binding protein PstS [Rhodospirillales bacterium TMPK1]